MIRVLDSYALMCFFEKEPGWEKVEEFFLNATEKGIPLEMTSVNFGEIYYLVLRENGPVKARDVEHIIQSLPISIVPVDQDLARIAAKIKAFHKISYADCFAAALAMVRKGEVITGDKEFQPLETDIKIFWLK